MLDMLRAHGLDAGPTQRPVLAGALCGVMADLAALPLLHAFGSFERLAPLVGEISVWVQVASTALAGAGYGMLFQRAANDVRGGWLFGMAYGYLVWQVISVPALQWIPARPLLDGQPAQGLLLGHLAWGLAAGFLFPLVHWPLKARVDKPRSTMEARGFGQRQQ
jgi:hypothetical protein